MLFGFQLMGKVVLRCGVGGEVDRGADGGVAGVGQGEEVGIGFFGWEGGGDGVTVG